jgi:hypothetical protein
MMGRFMALAAVTAVMVSTAPALAGDNAGRCASEEAKLQSSPASASSGTGTLPPATAPESSQTGS